MHSTAPSGRTVKSRAIVASAPVFRCTARAEKRKEVVLQSFVWEIIFKPYFQSIELLNHIECNHVRPLLFSFCDFSFIRSWRKSTRHWRLRKTNVKQGPRYITLSSISQPSVVSPMRHCSHRCNLFLPMLLLHALVSFHV